MAGISSQDMMARIINRDKVANLEAARTVALKAFLSADFRTQVLAARSAVTPEMYRLYTNAYTVGAWYLMDKSLLRDPKSPKAADMLRAFAKLPTDTPDDSKAFRAEVNFSDYVRNRSPHALKNAGATVPARKGRPTVDKVTASLTKALSKVNARKADPAKVNALLRVVQDFAAKVRKAQHAAKPTETKPTETTRTGTDG